MRKPWLLSMLLGLWCLSLAVPGCDNQEEPRLELASFNDMGCAEMGLPKDIGEGDDYLSSWQLEGGILTLDFRFFNTCGSAYADSVVLEVGAITIALADTAVDHARCTCEQQCRFQFEVAGWADVRLILMIDYYAVDGYVTCLDTVLSLQ